VFELWTKGLREEQVVYYKRNLLAKNTDSESELLLLLYRDTTDQYRLLGLLQEYLEQPCLLERQLVCQLSPPVLSYVVCRYYEFDDDVILELVSRKLSGRTRKDLDEVAECTGSLLGNCRRQYDNLRNIYTFLEEKSFETPVPHVIAEQYKIPLVLAERYTCLMFILYSKITLQSKKKAFFFRKLVDLEFSVALILLHWVNDCGDDLENRNGFSGDQYFQIESLELDKLDEEVSEKQEDEVADADEDDESDGEFYNLDILDIKGMRARSGSVTRPSVRKLGSNAAMELSPDLILQWRTIKNYFFVTRNSVDEAVKDILSHIQIRWPANTRYIFKKLRGTRFKNWFRYILTIGAGLGQAKELRDLFEDIEVSLCDPLHQIDLDSKCLSIVLEQVQKHMASHGFIVAQKLQDSWTTYFSVLSKILLKIY